VRKNEKGKGKIFKEIAEVLSATGEFKPYCGVKVSKVTSKCNDSLAQCASKATEASSKSGCDDEEFGELEKLLQDALDLENGAHKIRSDQIDEDEKARADDALPFLLQQDHAVPAL
jgi:hypothetical protein